MWVTPRDTDGPYIHISASYGSTLTNCQATQTLTDFGVIEIGESYHLIITTNATFTTITASSSEKSGVYPFPRESPTDPEHIGRTATVYFMSGKVTYISSAGYLLTYLQTNLVD